MIDINSVFMVSLIYVSLGLFVVGLIYTAIVRYSDDNKVSKDVIIICLLVVLNAISIALGVNIFK
jgi:hypothetical protein